MLPFIYEVELLNPVRESLKKNCKIFDELSRGLHENPLCLMGSFITVVLWELSTWCRLTKHPNSRSFYVREIFANGYTPSNL